MFAPPFAPPLLPPSPQTASAVVGGIFFYPSLQPVDLILCFNCLNPAPERELIDFCGYCSDCHHSFYGGSL